MVNRVWRHHFGRGLVESPSDFGFTGETPSHPELLEDLTAHFVANGWSLKWLHSEILALGGVATEFDRSSLRGLTLILKTRRMPG